MLAVLTGLMVPRMMATERRRAKVTVDSLARMLTVVAQREALGSHRMRLTFDEKRGAVRLDSLRLVGERGEPVLLGEEDWRADPLAPEVKLEGVHLAEVRFDGRAAEDKRWRVEFVPQVPRPLIELVVELGEDASARGSGKAWLIELLPYAPEADIVSVGLGGSVRGRRARSVDLDAMGRGDVEW